METQEQEQGSGLTLENLARSIPERINATRERVNSDREVKKKASQLWAQRGEKYDAFSFELGNNVVNFLKDYVVKLWPTIKIFLESSENEGFEVDALKRKFMREQPYLSFVPNRDSPIIWYYQGFRSGSDYEPKNISIGILEEIKNVQDLGSELLSEKYFYGNASYSKWNKSVDNVPELPSEQEVQELYNEFTNCVLSSTTEVLDKLMVESLNK
jgi:hypothetical protein